MYILVNFYYLQIMDHSCSDVKLVLLRCLTYPLKKEAAQNTKAIPAKHPLLVTRL
jgi:hypothetical protein